MAVPKGCSIVRATHEIVDAALTFRLQFLRIAREHASFPPIYPVDISLWTPESCADLDALNQCWNDLIAQRTRYVSELDESKFDADMPFKLLSGDASSMRLADQKTIRNSIKEYILDPNRSSA